jgi:hypothetical protein
MKRVEKLDHLKQQRAAENMTIVTNGAPFIEALQAKIDQFKDSLGEGVEITNLDELIDELQNINALKVFVSDLKETIKNLHIPEMPKQVEIRGLDSLLEVCKAISEKKELPPIDVKVFDTISAKTDSLIKEVQKLQVPKQGQKPEDYLPMRRVVNVEGVGLLYDDSFYTGGGGGGSNYDGIIKGANGGSATVTNGKLDVNATVTSSGQYAEDAGHTSGDTGGFILGVRNDTLTTLTSTDLDYSPVSVSKSGRIMAHIAPHDAMVRGTATTTGTGDTSLVAASGDNALKTYITDIQIANTGSTTSLITFKDGNAGSTLGYTIAPAGGGSNIHFDVPLVTTSNTAFYFTAASASTTIYGSAQGYKAP